MNPSDQTGTLERLYNKKETAQYFDTSEETVDDLRRKGFLKAIKIGVQVRFTQSELTNYLERQKQLSFVRVPRKAHKPAESGNRRRSHNRKSKRAA
jgi:excisionase family DNA binding protein